MKPDIHKTKRRRTCYDRTRKRWLEARRVWTSNPAASSAMQLLGIFGFLLGRMPVAAPVSAPQRYVAPAMSPRQVQRIEAARHLGVPTRYLDIVLSKGKVPYPVLVEHIRQGGATRRDALDELRKSAPVEALDWLAHVEERHLWSELSRCFRPDASEEDAHVLMLKATLAWVEAQKKSGGGPSVPSDTEHELKPPKPGDDDKPEDDPQSPKP